jgi:glycerol-3-phosphate dehydrogenase
LKRDFESLGDGPFDLLVIGGGVYGAWIAYDAALRGLSVALVERTDWAAGTSSASSKLIHGGLRYLEHRQIDLVRKTLAERRLLCRLGPHRVRPLRFLMPVYKNDRVGRVKMKAGLWLYDKLAGHDPVVGGHESVDVETALRHYDLRPEGLRGGFLFGDCQTDDARFVLEIVDGACDAGAVAVNRAEATALLWEGDRVVGATVEDAWSGKTIEVRASVTVSASGAWNAEADNVDVRLTKGVHLVMPPLPADEGLLISSDDDGRIVFVIPWYGRTLVGTTDTDFDGSPDEVCVEREDIDYLLARVNGVIAGAPWRPSDVIATFAGLRTLPVGGDLAPSAVTREWSLEEPNDRLLVPVGGKYTSARADAATAVDRVVSMLGREAFPCLTADRPFPWAPTGDYREWSVEALRVGLGLGLDEETVESCQQRHGARIEKIFERIRQSPELAQRVVPDAPFCLAEVIHAVTDEMAATLEDILRRRVPLLLVSRVSTKRLEEIAVIVGAFLGWSDARRRQETAWLQADSAGSVPAHETA